MVKFWVVLKNGDSKHFASRKEAKDWEKNQPGRYHIYDDATDKYAKKTNAGTSFRNKK